MQVTDRIRIEFPDEDLRQRIESFLKSRHFPDFETLHVDVHDGSVTLSGSLRSYYEKQVALNSCQRVAGVLTLIDNVDVHIRKMAATRAS
jgi:osmotically-inducible protein OsmY